MSQSQHSSRLEEIRAWTRGGQRARAKTALSMLERSRIPAREVHDHADLWRELGHPLQALRTLVGKRSPELWKKNALPKELALYGICLAECGRLDEAEAVLTPISPARYPLARQHLAWCLMRSWRWNEAQSILKQALAEPGLMPHQRAVSRTFLGSCLLNGAGDAVAAEAQLRQALEELRVVKYRRPERTTRLLLAQALQAQDKKKEALQALDEAQAAQEGYGLEVQDLLIAAWRSVIAPEKFGSWHKARQSLAGAGHWEWLRAMEFKVALQKNDRALLQRLWFGSPYPALREQVLKALGPDGLPGQVDLPLSEDQESKGRTLLIDPQDLGLKEGQLLHRLLHALLADHFRPSSVAELHTRIFPNETFNPASSPNRIHQSVFRFQRWLERAKLPLKVESQGQGYRLLSSGVSCRVRMRREIPVSLPARRKALLLRLKKAIPDGAFTVVTAASVLGTSRPTAFRLLREACVYGLLSPEAGEGKATAYRFGELPKDSSSAA